MVRKDGVFYYRRVLPGAPRQQVAVSLGTRRLWEAEDRARELDGAYGRELGRLQAMTDTPSPSNLAAILREHLRQSLAEHLSPMPHPRGHAPRVLWPEGLLEDGVDQARRSLTTRDSTLIGHEVDRLMRTHGLPGTMRAAVEIGVLEADLRVYEEALRRVRGEVPVMLVDDAPDTAMGLPEGVTPRPPSLAPAPSAPSAPATAPLASSLVDPFFVRREKIDRTRHQVMGQERTTLRLFLEVCGDRPMADYRRGDVTTFLGTLRRMPNTYGRSPKDRTRTVAEIIAEADSRDAQRLTDKTVKRHLSAVSQFFRFAVDAGHLTVAARGELVGDHSFTGGRRARDQRNAWTPEELTKLFKSPIWTGRHRFYRTRAGGEIIRDAKFWLPLLALFHGARLEEFADLYRRDVGRDDGTWFVALTEAAPDEEEGSGGRRLKNANAERNVPIHPEVIRLGFLDYIAKTAPNPNDPLFPDLRPQGEDRRRGASVTRWFVEYRRAVGVYRPGVAIHAFRHTANTRLRDDITNWQQERHANYLFGHSQGGGEGRERYDKGPGLKAVAKTLALLRYPEVDLSHLYADAE